MKDDLQSILKRIAVLEEKKRQALPKPFSSCPTPITAQQSQSVLDFLKAHPELQLKKS